MTGLEQASAPSSDAFPARLAASAIEHSSAATFSGIPMHAMGLDGDTGLVTGSAGATTRPREESSAFDGSDDSINRDPAKRLRLDPYALTGLSGSTGGVLNDGRGNIGHVSATSMTHMPSSAGVAYNPTAMLSGANAAHMYSNVAPPLQQQSPPLTAATDAGASPLDINLYMQSLPPGYSLPPAMVVAAQNAGVQPQHLQFLNQQRQYAATMAAAAQRQQQQQQQQQLQQHRQQQQPESHVAMMEAIIQEQKKSQEALAAARQAKDASAASAARPPPPQSAQAPAPAAAPVAVVDESCFICSEKGGVFTCKAGCGLHVHPACIGEELLFPSSGATVRLMDVLAFKPGPVATVWRVAHTCLCSRPPLRQLLRDAAEPDVKGESAARRHIWALGTLVSDLSMP